MREINIYYFPAKGISERMAVITSRHLFGWKCENILRPVLEQILDEPLTKTSNRFNSIDYRGDYWVVELKSRPTIDEYGRHQDSNTYPDWLIPTCKENTALNLENGEVIFFYFWQGDNTLWFCRYDKEEFASIRRSVPWFSSQEHFWIPKEKFEQLDVQIPLVV